MLDIALEIPPLLQDWDMAKTENAVPWSPFKSSMSTEEIQKLLVEMLAIHPRLEEWYTDFTSPVQEYGPIAE